MSTRSHTRLFTQVDRTNDPDFFVRFMDEAQQPAGIQASKRLMLERMALASGAAVLEVGCGPGTDVFDLVDTVGPAGRLVGLDASEAMIAEARRRASEHQVPITFEVGDVASASVPRRNVRRVPRRTVARAPPRCRAGARGDDPGYPQRRPGRRLRF
jgi:cyclopropane fatty-acyl-phospholipid synthase-like methyltransferase